MRGSVPLGLGLMLAACSGGSEEGAGDASSAKSAVDTPAPAIVEPSSDGAARSGGLRGEVSRLNASISDLSTRMTAFGTVIDLPADALFEFEQAVLTPDAESLLRKSLTMIGAAPAGPVKIVGHTDAKGEPGYNLTLSKARAEAVADWFRQQPGARQRVLQVSGRGEAAPIAPNDRADGSDDPDGRARNRRVEVIVPNA